MLPGYCETLKHRKRRLSSEIVVLSLEQMPSCPLYVQTDALLQEFQRPWFSGLLFDQLPERSEELVCRRSDCTKGLEADRDEVAPSRHAQVFSCL